MTTLTTGGLRGRGSVDGAQQDPRLPPQEGNMSWLPVAWRVLTWEAAPPAPACWHDACPPGLGRAAGGRQADHREDPHTRQEHPTGQPSSYIHLLLLYHLHLVLLHPPTLT